MSVTQPSSEILVVGAGLPRTGTGSLKKALELLLDGRCYHMSVVDKDKRHHLKLWRKAALHGLNKELADEIFHGFSACADFPAAYFYPELLKLYPNAKFILSLRDPERWAQSMRSTIIDFYDSSRSTFLPPVSWLMNVYELRSLDESISLRMECINSKSDEAMMKVFERHNQAVIATIPKDRLLIFRVSDGWEPLCKFLDLPVPGVPFPNVNDTLAFQRRTRKLMWIGRVLNTVFCVAVGAAGWYTARYCLKRWG